MTPLFNVGDKVYSLVTKKYYTIKCVVLGRKEIFGRWVSGLKSAVVIDGYVLESEVKSLSWVTIKFQNKFELIVSKKEGCLWCDGEIGERYSEHTHSVIKKCKKCGWC